MRYSYGLPSIIFCSVLIASWGSLAACTSPQTNHKKDGHNLLHLRSAASSPKISVDPSAKGFEYAVTFQRSSNMKQVLAQFINSSNNDESLLLNLIPQLGEYGIIPDQQQGKTLLHYLAQCYAASIRVLGGRWLESEADAKVMNLKRKRDNIEKIGKTLIQYLEQTASAYYSNALPYAVDGQPVSPEINQLISSYISFLDIKDAAGFTMLDYIPFFSSLYYYAKKQGAEHTITQLPEEKVLGPGDTMPPFIATEFLQPDEKRESEYILIEFLHNGEGKFKSDGFIGLCFHEDASGLSPEVWYGSEQQGLPLKSTQVEDFKTIKLVGVNGLCVAEYVEYEVTGVVCRERPAKSTYLEKIFSKKTIKEPIQLLFGVKETTKAPTLQDSEAIAKNYHLFLKSSKGRWGMNKFTLVIGKEDNPIYARFNALIYTTRLNVKPS